MTAVPVTAGIVTPAEAELPSVSVVIPCRNEVSYIDSCITSVLASDYPRHLLEILIVDGASTDGTRESLVRWQMTSAIVHVLDNPRRTVPVAMNIGIKAACGDVVVRMDAHCEYPRDYIRQCAAFLVAYGVDNVGGSLKTEPANSSRQAAAVALAQTSRFGVGAAAYRLGTETVREADTVPFGTYWRKRLIELGMYNEAFVRNQDIELNARLRAQGGRILYVPSIHCRYFAKRSIGLLARQCYYNGFWVVYGLRFARAPFSPRHLVPFMCLIVSVVLALSGWFVPLLVLMVMYLALDLGTCAMYSIRHRAPFAWLLLTFPTMHLSYAVGSMNGGIALLCHQMSHPGSEES